MGIRASKREFRQSKSFRDSEIQSSTSNPTLPSLPTTPPDPEKVLFGIPLNLAAQRSDECGMVPSPIRNCIEFLENKGLKNVGLYRIPGSAKRINELISLYNTGEKVVLPENEDVHTIVGVIKAFLRELPDPVFTNEARPEFRSAGDIYDDDKRVKQIRQIVASLPDCNRETLKLLIFHLARVAENAAENKMTPNNLTFSLCPELGCVFTTMIEHTEEVFKKPEPAGGSHIANSRKLETGSARYRNNTESPGNANSAPGSPAGSGVGRMRGATQTLGGSGRF